MPKETTKPQVHKMLVIFGEDGSMHFAPDESPDLPDNIEDGVDDNGIVEGHIVETFYCAFKDMIEGDGYLRVVGDNDFTDVEIRIPFDLLRALGWQKNDHASAVSGNNSDAPMQASVLT